MYYSMPVEFALALLLILVQQYFRRHFIVGNHRYAVELAARNEITCQSLSLELSVDTKPTYIIDFPGYVAIHNGANNTKLWVCSCLPLRLRQPSMKNSIVCPLDTKYGAYAREHSGI